MKMVKTLAEIQGKAIAPPNARMLQIVYSKMVDEGAGDFTFLISTLRAKDGQTDFHIHPVDEMILIMSGRGEGLMGEDQCNLEAGTVLYAPAGIRHQCRNLSDESMQMACFYIPALPDEIVQSILDGATEKVSVPRQA